MSVVGDHVAALIIHLARQRGGTLGVFEDDLPSELEKIYQIRISDPIIHEALQSLAKSTVVKRLDSDLAGNLLQLSADRAMTYFGPGAQEPGQGTSVQYDNAYDAAHLSLPMMNAYAFGGQDWVNRVVAKLQSGQFDSVAPVADGVEIGVVPASDRIVRLNDNQIDALSNAIDDVATGVGKENAIDGDPNIRERFLGELAAGRELVRAKSVRAYLLYETLVKLLSSLIDRYKDQALAEAAKKLLELLIEHVFGK